MLQLVSSAAASPARLGLQAGDWVYVRPADEILATLDARGWLDDLPFQPEMLAFCGRRMRVAKVAHKTCDNIRKTGGRRMASAVHLEGGRCDGAAHGGCQADCVFFWKEAWLRRDGDARRHLSAPRGQCTEATLRARVRADGEEDAADPTWVCQTTKLYDATQPLHWWDARQYVRDVTSGNHRAWDMVKLLVFSWYRTLVGLGVGYRILVGLFDRFQALAGGKPYPSAGEGRIPNGAPTPTQILDLQPGELVEVRPPDEIMATLNEAGYNRGMLYTIEMLQYSGERHRVEMRVERLINEQTGKMMTMKNPCIQLEDVFCRARCTDRRLGCPRASNTYWREIWLRRVEDRPVEKATRVQA